MRIFVLRSLWAGAKAEQSEETPVTAHKELKTIIRTRAEILGPPDRSQFNGKRVPFLSRAEEEA
jgi:hypothetical protein